MNDIPTITYKQAKEWFDSGRKHKPIGVKLTKDIWLNYDEANDCYTLAYTHSRWYEVVNAQGETAHKWASTKERDKYTQRFIGFVYRDHAHIFPPDLTAGMNLIACGFFTQLFKCTYRKSSSIKVKGFEWEFFRKNNGHWNVVRGTGEVKLSGAGMKIFPDGTRLAAEPVKVRVHKKEKQKAMNDHIKAVRRMLTLRAKLGGFNSVNWPQVAVDMEMRYGRSYHVLHNSEIVNRIFMEINGEDYLTMIPVLWLAACHKAACYWHRVALSDINSSYDWTSAFNGLVNFVREGLRNEQGAVEYVIDQQTQEGS